MAKEEDVQDLDQIFETEENENSEESDSSTESYMVSDEDYKSDIGSVYDEEESEYNESVDNLILNKNDDKFDDSVIDELSQNDVIGEESIENVSSEEIDSDSEKNETEQKSDIENGDSDDLVLIEDPKINDLQDNDLVEDDEILENSEEESIENVSSEEIDSDSEKNEIEEDSDDSTLDNENSEDDDSEEKNNGIEDESDIIDEMVNPVAERIINETDEDFDDESEDLVSESDENVENDVFEDKKESETNDSEENKPISTGSYKEFKKEAFWRTVREIQDRYPETDLLEYIDRYKNEDNNADIIKEMYTNVLIEYNDCIDFNNNEDARNNAWIIVGGKFADLIERRKSMGIIESSVEVKQLGKTKDVDEIDDPNVQASIKDRQRHQSEIDKYSIDRTVFAIASDESEEDASIFEDKKAVDREFYEGPFYKILKEVMISDRCADMSKIYMKVIINPDTSFIPVVDFSSGVRFVCIDVTDVDQYRIHAMALARQIPFSFASVNPRSIKTRVLYSDMCLKRPVATTFAIKKLVAFEYWNPKHKISLQHNFAVAYTTENQYVEMFENGDPDSKNPENCVNVARKPKTCSFGIIALDKKSEKDRQAMRRKQGKKVLNYMNNIGDYEQNRNDYNIHFVLSASVICNDRDLVNPGIPAEDRMVHYEITRYCECNSVIIFDGLQTICTCIVKEHKKKYGPGTKYTIEFDYDPTELLTPGVIGLIDAHDGIELSTYKKSNPMSITCSYIMPPSRLKMDGVFEFEKGRMDYRNFNPATLSIYYPRELYSRYNINTVEGRAEFLRSRGFEEFWQPAIATFDIMPYVLNIIEVGSFINEITHVNISTLSDRDSTDINGLLYQQQKLEYVKNLDNSSYSGFQKFLFGVLDFLIDSQSNN